MSKELMNKTDIDRALTRMAHEIIEKNKGTDKLCLIGIQRGGAHLAKRLAAKITQIEKKEYPGRLSRYRLLQGRSDHQKKSAHRQENRNSV